MKELIALKIRLENLISALPTKSKHNKAVVDTYIHVLAMIETRIAILKI
jgi:hypothetical protein